MKKLYLVCLMIAVSISMVTSVYAASPSIGAGSNEAFGQINLRSTSSKPDGGGTTSTSESTSIVAGYGRFVTDQLQLGFSFMGSLSKQGSSSDTTGTTGVDLFVKYHFMSKGQIFVPYLGIQGGYMNSDQGKNSSASAGSYGAMGGFKYFLTENLALNTELNYRRYQMEFGSGSFKSKSTTDDMQLLLGFAYYF